MTMQTFPRDFSPAASPHQLFAERRPLHWLWSLDHRRIALLQFSGIAVACLMGGLLGLVLQSEKATPELHTLSEHTFAAAFSMHGAVMLFLVLLPAIPGVLGAFVLPDLVGAKNLAFPRLHLMSVQFWSAGAFCFVAAMVVGGATTGWTLSVPLSLESHSGDIWLATGLALVALSILLRSLTLMTTVLGLRRRGLAWSACSPIVWALVAHGAVTLVAAPIVLVSVVMLLGERAWGLGLFDPSLGGDPLLFQTYFWFGMHALAYTTVVPAVGAVSHVFAESSPGGLRAPRSLVMGLIGLSLAGLLSWGIQTPTSGHGMVPVTFFSLVTLLGAVPMAQVVGSWLLTLRAGGTQNASSWFALGAAGVLVIGGLATLPLAALGTAVHLHGTAYAVGQSHLVLSSVALSAIAGLVHFWPAITGRWPSRRLAGVGAVLLPLGLLASFAPQLLIGALGLPRRMAEFPSAYAPWQWLSLAGTWLLALGVIATVASLRGNAPRPPGRRPLASP